MDQLCFRLITAAVAALSCFVLGSLAYRKDKSSPLHRYFAFFNLSLGIWNISDVAIAVGPPDWSLFLDRLSYVWATLMVPSFVFLSSEFANRPVRSRWVKRMIGWPGIFILGSAFTPWLIEGVKTAPHFVEMPGPLYVVFALYLLWWIGFGAVQVFLGYRAATGGRKNQLRYVFLGFFFGFLAAADYLATIAFPSSPPFYYVLEATYTTIIFFAIVKHRLMAINLAFRYATIGFNLMVMSGTPFAVVIWFLTHDGVATTVGLIAPLTTYFVGVKLRMAVTNFVDKLPPFRGRYDTLKDLPLLQRRVIRQPTVEDWADAMTSAADQMVETTGICLYHWDLAAEYLDPKSWIRLNRDTVFSNLPMVNSALVRRLESMGGPLLRDQLIESVEGGETAEARRIMEGLGMDVCLPFFLEGRVIGFLALGGKIRRGRRRFHEADLNLDLLREGLYFPFQTDRNSLKCRRLMLSALGLDGDHVAGVSNRKIVDVLNGFVRDPGFHLRLDTARIPLRSESLALWQRVSSAGSPLTVGETEIMNRGILEALLPEETAPGMEKDDYHGEDLKALWALTQAANDTLVLIMKTLDLEKRTSQWAHDMMIPFKKGGYLELEDMARGRYGALTEDQHRALKVILKDFAFIRDNVGAVVHMQEQSLKIVPTALTQVYLDSLDRFTPACKEKGVVFKAIPPDGKKVLCDEQIITHRVISNLMDNAIRHTSAGGEILLGHEFRNGRFVGFVRNTGAGITNEGFKHLFQRGKQGMGGGERGMAGLGLYNVAKVMESHHGRAWAESDPGHGATFYFELPLA